MSANTVLFRVLLAITLLAPLPLGSNRPWAWSLLAVGAGLLTLVWSALVFAGRARAPVPFSRLWPLALPFALVLGWATLQTTALTPPDLWHPMWAEAARALGGPATGMITADPALTRAAILRLASYGAVFWLAAQLGRDRARAREAVVAVCVAGTVYASYGLIVYFAGWDSILWLSKWAYQGDLTSTFVNRNAYGAYAGLGVVCCIGLFAHSLRQSQSGRERRAYDLAETVLLRALPYLLSGLIIGSALLLSHSRGAFLSTALALGVLLVLLGVAGVIRPRMAVPLTGAVMVIGLVALSMSGDVTMARLVEHTSHEHDAGRTELYRLTMDAIEDAPLTGMGLGAFLPAFRVYRDATLDSPVIWDFAHNVHLELAMDLGLPAAALFYLCFAVIAAVCLRGLLRRRRDRIYPALALAATVLLAAHGLVDFSPQMPAIAATFALLLGIGYAQSWNTAKRDEDEAAEDRASAGRSAA